MNWATCINTFIQVVKLESFTQASIQLTMPQSTVTKHIQWLEHEVGSKLLHRTTRKLQLTEQGEFLYHRSTPLMNE